ncbi:CerR family C-terminal domain-containing protein [Candidatus Sumerlaeota bacterium]|nr:CerR family C-terminal domain-containing protein [Candidatus Sumerlaeota bacterium]
MADDSSQTHDTRERILDAAIEEFALNGFKNSTTRAICRRAGVNNAAVNYHFRDKQHLYHSALEEALARHMTRWVGEPLHEGVTAEERLFHFISDQLTHMLGAGSPDDLMRIVSHELLDPTSAIDLFVAEAVNVVHAPARAIVQELLGPEASPQAVSDCIRSVLAQCFLLSHARAIISRMEPESAFDERSIPRHAEHITRFSLGGIAACRESLAHQDS